MRDVDNFQRGNDTLGRGAGDTLLHHMARLLRSRTPAGGSAARYGGEEFTPVMPQAPRAAPLRRVVKQLAPPSANRGRDPITLARGVARYPPPGSSVHLLRPAAGALYPTQPGGRDRAAVAPAQ
jgi:diguanylate cyclase (GGDEF)-like protein